MCGTYLAAPTADAPAPAFESLLAHLVVESHGLNRSGLCQLFCQAAGDHFGASGVCCARFSGENGWVLEEVAGYQAWGRAGEALPSTPSAWLESALTTGNAVARDVNSTETLYVQGDTQCSTVAIPFVSHGLSLGASLMTWTKSNREENSEFLERLTLLGSFFAG